MTPAHLPKIVFVVIATLAITTNLQAYSAGNRVQCNSTNVNVRSSPSTSGSIVGTVSSPDKGSVVSGPYSGTGSTGWYYINWDKGISGYTAQEYLQLAPAPTATTNSPTNITSSGAVFHGTVNPNGTTTNVYFDYGNTASYGSTTGSSNFTGTSSIAVQSTLSGASANTTFHYRVVAASNAGVAYGNDVSFTTSAQGPSVTTTAATNVSSTSATLNGTVNPNGSATTAHFEFGLSTNYGASTSNTNVGSGISSVNVQAPTGSIQPGQTFHYRLVATNAGGTVYGNDVVFTTSNGPPYALTNAASNITSNSFQGNATINPNGLSTTAYFQYGLTTNYGSSNPPGTFTGSANLSVSATLNTNVQPNTTYHYRVVASSSGGTTYGNDVTLTTPGGPTPTPTPSPTPTPTATATPTATPSGSPGAPTIANVNPNPVTGSTSSQPFTINGSNLSSSSVVNLRNLTTGTPYLNRTVNSQSATRLVINPIFGTEAHTWSIEVVNGTASSGQYQFQVQTPVAAPRPDLMPSNVQANPSSLQIGNSVAVTLTISNPGPADAVASTTRVRISTSTSSTSSADVALGDIATPAIAAGSSKTISGSFTLPSGATVGTNYVWVSVDNNKVTNESDGTNDYAHSPAVSVTGTTIAKPVIQSLTGDQTINHDEVAILSVTASGPGHLSYQWNRNNKPIPGATPNSIRTNQGGSYTVDVSNSGGTTTSVTTTLTVNPFSNPPPPGTGSLRSPFAFNSFWPTVVVTHGWEPTGDYNANGESWQTEMALGIRGRFVGRAVNVLTYTWPEAYTHSYVKWSDARTATQSEGHELARALRTFVGPDYQEKLHFVGHSYGTFLNAYAIYNFTGHVDQLTILDAPIDVRAAGVKAHYPNDDVFFRLLLSKDRVDYVDSYIATVPTAQALFGGALFGGVIAGSAPNEGLPVDFSHLTIVGHYQDTTIAGNSYPLGFNCSALLGSDAQPIDRWNPPNLLQQTLGEFTDVASATSGDVTLAVDNVRGTNQGVFRLHTSGSASTADGVRENQALASAGDSAVEFEVSVPSDAQYVNFDFLFSQLGEGDWMTVSFADEVLYSFVGKSFASSTYEEAVISISKFTGQTGVVRVVLHTVSSASTEVSVSNFHFASSFVGVSALGNISTRLYVGTGDNALIGGFIITGTQPKKVIVRGIGSSLPLGNKLENPTLELHDASGALVDSNDNWIDSPNKQAIIDSTIPPTNDLESAIVATLPANNSNYTAVLRGANNGTGIGVVEAYDLDQSVDSKLANISTRGFVNTGDNVLIGGTIIIGSSPANVLIRAIGPSLTTVSNALQDPTLELHDGQGNVITSNDNWRDTQEAAIIATTIPPTDNRESAILANLQPGQYTAIVRGAGNSTGVAVVEAYQLP